MKIHFADSIYWEKLGPEFQESYKRNVTDAYEEARQLLPGLSKHVNFFVQPREYDLIEETQDSGYTTNSELILLGFHPEPKVGLEAILKHIRATVFHECNHAARYNTGEWHETLLDQAIMEGLATAFERDYADANPPWGQYKAEEATAWLEEIKGLDEGFKWDDYMFKHPDGRKWIGYKTGTFIVDRAVEYSGKTIPELTVMKCADILTLAKIS